MPRQWRLRRRLRYRCTNCRVRCPTATALWTRPPRRRAPPPAAAHRRCRPVPRHPWRRRCSRRRRQLSVRRHGGLCRPAAGTGSSRSEGSRRFAPAHRAAPRARDCAGSARARRRYSRRRSALRAHRVRRVLLSCRPRRGAHARAASARSPRAPFRGSAMSSAKQPLPVSSRKSSLRRTGCPIPVPLTVARIRFSQAGR